MCDQNQSKPILKTCFFPRGVSLKNLPINETSNTNAAPGPLPGPAPPPTADGQACRQAGRGSAAPLVCGAHEPSRHHSLQSRHVHSGSKPYLQLHCSRFAKKTRTPEELICIHLPKTMWICPKYTCEFWVWKHWSLKRWEGQDLTTKDILLCCSFQWAKQNYWQFSPI